MKKCSRCGLNNLKELEPKNKQRRFYCNDCGYLSYEKNYYLFGFNLKNKILIRTLFFLDEIIDILRLILSALNAPWSPHYLKYLNKSVKDFQSDLSKKSFQIPFWVKRILEAFIFGVFVILIWNFGFRLEQLEIAIFLSILGLLVVLIYLSIFSNRYNFLIKINYESPLTSLIGFILGIPLGISIVIYLENLVSRSTNFYALVTAFTFIVFLIFPIMLTLLIAGQFYQKDSFLKLRKFWLTKLIVQLFLFSLIFLIAGYLYWSFFAITTSIKTIFEKPV